MGVRFPGSYNTTVVNTTIVTTAETAVLTSAPISPSVDFGAVLIIATVCVQAGTGVVNVAMRLRRGTTVAGTLVTTNLQQASGAAVAGTYTIVYPDNSPGLIAGQQYTLTLVMTSATGNSTVVDGCIAVLAL